MLRVAFKSRVPHIEKTALSFFEEMTVDLNNNSANLKEVIQARLNRIFELRIDLIKWIIEKNYDFSLSNEIEKDFAKMKSRSDLKNLSNKIIEFLPILNSMSSGLIQGLQIKEDNEIFDKLQSLNWDQFRASVLLTADHQTAEFIFDWTISSLSIDYILCAVLLIYDKELHLPLSRIEELSSLLSSSYTSYIGKTIEAGLLKQGSTSSSVKKGKTKGFDIFKQMLSDKNEVRDYIRTGGRFSELQNRYPFVKSL